MADEDQAVDLQWKECVQCLQVVDDEACEQRAGCHAYHAEEFPPGEEVVAVCGSAETGYGGFFDGFEGVDFVCTGSFGLASPPFRSFQSDGFIFRL